MSVITDIIVLQTYDDWRQVGGYNRIGNEYKAVISKRDDSIGAPVVFSDVKGYSSSPINISTGYSDKNIFDPVAGSRVTIQMVTDSPSELLEMARGDDTKHRVVVSEGVQVLFRGYIRPETYRQEYEREKPVIKVDATDGIGLLRNVKFLDEIEDYSVIKGLHPVREVMSYLLWKAGNRENWRDYVYYATPGNTGKNLIRYMEIPVWKYYDWTCYDVLLDVLSIFNMQLVQVDGVYRTRLADQPYGKRYDWYSYKGVSISASAEFTVEAIDIHDKFKGVQGDFRMERPVREIQFEAPQLVIPDMIFNGDFAMGKTGWTEWGSLPDSMWSINSENILNMSRVVVGEFDIYAEKGIKSNYSRGMVTQNTNIVVKIEARSHGFPSLPLRVGLKSNVLFQRTLTDKWVTYEFEWFLPSGETETKIYIESPTRREWEAGVGSIQINSISIQPTYTTLIEVEDIDNDSEVALNDKSQQDITHKIAYAWGGNVYRFENTFPGAANKNDIAVVDRSTDPPVGYTNHTVQTGRAKKIYKDVKMRVSLDMYKDETPLRIDSVMYDKHYRRAYVITSLSYDMAKAMYSAEALEHARMYIGEPEPDSDWILATGKWNDDGYWRDDEYWIDD